MMWFMRWVPFALTHGHNPLVTTWVLYPNGSNLMWNTSILFPSALLSSVTLVEGPVFAYNTLHFLAFTLSGWSAYFAIRRITNTWLGAVVGGAVYAFSPFMLGHGAGHAQLFVAIGPPMFLLLLYEITCGTGSPRWPGVGLGLVAAAQLLTGEELLAISGLASLLSLLIIAFLLPSQVTKRARRLVVGTSWSFLVFLPLAVLPLAVQFHGPQRLSGILHSDIALYSNDLLNLIVPTILQQVDPAALQNIAEKFTGNTAEQTGYLGVPLLVLLAIALVRPRRHAAAAWAALVALLFAGLSLGPHLHLGGKIGAKPLPWILFQALPLLGNTLSSRLMVISYLFSGVVVGWAIGRAQVTRGPERAVLTGLVGLSLVLLTPTFDYPTRGQTVPAFFTSSGGVGRIAERDVVVISPFVSEPWYAELWQAVAGMRFRTPGGYLFIPSPEGARLSAPPSALTDMLSNAESGRSVPLLDPATRGGIAADLQRWNAREIVVGPEAHEANAVQFLTQLMRRPPEQSGGVYIWWNVSPDQVR